MLVGWFLSAVAATPFILFDKKTSDDFGKVGDPIHGIYKIVNLGDTPATNLHIDDAGVPLEQWEFPKSADGEYHLPFQAHPACARKSPSEFVPPALHRRRREEDRSIVAAHLV
jgi:hypothetical protein